MTDNEWISVNEIIKFIEHAINSAKGEDGFKEIYWEKLEYILNLIKRQKAEIEGLEETRYELACIIDELLMCIAEGKETKSAKPIEIKCDDFENKSDFVNVVRCKDCKHCEKIIDQFDNDWYFCTETVNKAEVKPDDYCSYGERRIYV